MNTRRLDWNEEDIKREFSLHNGEMDGFEVVFSKDHSAPYETSYIGVLRKGGVLYRIGCGTCSCYTCEGQFNPVETSIEELKNDPELSFEEWSSICDYVL